MLFSGPPRFMFQPISVPPQRPASMMRSRRNAMLSFRVLRLTPALRRLGYLRETQSMMKSGFFEAQLPTVGEGAPPPPGGGAAVGALKRCASVQAPVVRGSDPRTRQ